MHSTELLDDAFGRLPGIAHGAVDGLSSEDLTWQVDPGANTIGWLVWHLARVQDDHVAELAGHEQLWVAQGWPSRFGLDDDSQETGFGHTVEQVLRVRPEGAGALLGYLEAVTARTREFLATVDAATLDRVVDDAWDPPVTMGVRLVSVLGDGMQHAGQAAFLRGILDRTR